MAFVVCCSVMMIGVCSSLCIRFMMFLFSLCVACGVGFVYCFVNWLLIACGVAYVLLLNCIVVLSFCGVCLLFNFDSVFQ